MSSFDADGSGQVDTEEFSNLLNEHIAKSQGKNVTTVLRGGGEGGDGAPAGDGNEGEAGAWGIAGIIRGGGKGLRDGRAVIGLQWDTRGTEDDDGRHTTAAAPASGSEVDLEAAAAAAAQPAMERMLADAIAQLFFTHRRELFHIWHSHFDVHGTGSISAEDFVCSVRVLDQAGGAGMLSEAALTRLVAVLDSNGDGRIDFMEFSRNIGSLVERVRGSR